MRCAVSPRRRIKKKKQKTKIISVWCSISLDNVKSVCCICMYVYNKNIYNIYIVLVLADKAGAHAKRAAGKIIYRTAIDKKTSCEHRPPDKWITIWTLSSKLNSILRPEFRLWIWISNGPVFCPAASVAGLTVRQSHTNKHTHARHEAIAVVIACNRECRGPDPEAVCRASSFAAAAASVWRVSLRAMWCCEQWLRHCCTGPLSSIGAVSHNDRHWTVMRRQINRLMTYFLPSNKQSNYRIGRKLCVCVSVATANGHCIWMIGAGYGAFIGFRRCIGRYCLVVRGGWGRGGGGGCWLLQTDNPINWFKSWPMTNSTGPARWEKRAESARENNKKNYQHRYWPVKISVRLSWPCTY